MITSLNNILICEPWSDLGKGLSTQVKSGFGTISQKIKLTPIKLLYNAEIRVNGTQVYLFSGSNLLIKEEDLFNFKWSKNIMELNEKKVILVPYEYIVAVENGLADPLEGDLK
jgi:hypothetical protein